MMVIRDLIVGSDLPRIESRLLLSYALQRDAAWLVAHDQDTLTADTLTVFQALVQRRLDGEPIAYIIGEREFYGRSYCCSPVALIPRPETEHLVDAALNYVALDTACRIADVGTGSGCIAITLKLERPMAQIVALDISAEALSLAHDNAQRLGADSIDFQQSNWFSALDDTEMFDYIVSNPPYIVPGDVHLSQGDLRFEPAIALTDSVDGLESYRQLLRSATQHLRSGGRLLVEHGYDQGKSVPALFCAAGFSDVLTLSDLAGHPRLTLGRYCRD